MNPVNFEQALRDFVRRVPFEPFEVELQDGQRFAVDSPDGLAFNDGGNGVPA